MMQASSLVFRGRQSVTEEHLEVDFINAVLSGQYRIEFYDPTITDVMIPYIIQKFHFYPDSKAPKELWDEIT